MSDTFISRSVAEPIALPQPTATKALTLSPTLEQHIEAGWQQFLRKRPGSTSEPLVRFLQDDGATMTVATDINYREVVGIRHAPPPEPVPLQALTVMAVVVTSDDQIVLQHRDSGDWPASYENVGWFIRASQVSETVDDIITRQVTREVATPTSCTYLGAYDALSIAEYMLVYRAELTETAAPLTNQAGIVTVPLTELEDFLREPSVPLHPPTAAVLTALCKAGR